MTLKKYLILMSIATFISLVILASIVFFLNPQETGWWGLALFYVSLFLTLLGIFTLLGFVLRVWLINTPVFQQVGVAFRQATWLAILVVFGLILQSYAWLNWWTMFLMVLLLSALETGFLFLNKKAR